MSHIIHFLISVLVIVLGLAAYSWLATKSPLAGSI
jgi:hypothetical protein